MTRRDYESVPGGRFFRERHDARRYAELYDKDCEPFEDGWVASDRATSQGPLPTRAGDVVVRHGSQRRDIWRVPSDGAQIPAYPNPELGASAWSQSAVETVLGEWLGEAAVQVFWLQANGEWVTRPWRFTP